MNISTKPFHFSSNHSTETNSTAIPFFFTWETVLIVLITGPLSVVTIIGNLLVIISFRVNSHLRTVSNYFLLSLALADLILGAVSMNLYTIYILVGHWTLGNKACDIWLAVDYVASNASVMNLLAICCDRYLSVTRPLTYRAKRTPKRVAIMIALAWGVSLMIWAPPILFWEDIVGERKVPEGDCSVQFFYEPVITFVTAIAAFYLPVTIMAVLYWRVYRETERRSQQLSSLTGTVTTALALTTQITDQQFSPSSSSNASSSGEPEAPEGPRDGMSMEVCKRDGRRCWFSILRCRKGKRKATGESHFSQSSVTRGRTAGSFVSVRRGSMDSDNGSPTAEHISRSVRRPLVQASENDDSSKRRGHRHAPHVACRRGFRGPLSSSPSSTVRPYTISLLASATVPTSLCSATKTLRLRRLRGFSLIRERKAARTLSAILLAFIITWTPYNIMVLVSTFCESCVPEQLWQLGYWLCYVNSTINPICYALCNHHFRATFKELLLCRWRKGANRRRWRNRWVRPGVG